jgi:hypothetical protein
MTLRARLTAKVVVAVGLCWSASADAGLLDSPPPMLANGARGTVVYRMGAVHFEPGGWVDTTVTCTNLAATPADVALEVFDENDHVAGTAAKSVAAGAAVTFATSSAVDASGAAVLAGLPPIDHGKARVSASTTQLTCVAVNRMRGADGAIKEAPLELIKKVAY